MENVEGMQPDQDISASISTQPQVAQEKMIPQSEVDRLVGAKKHEAYERGRREALERLQAEQAPRAPIQETQNTFGGMPQFSEDRIRDLIAEEAHKRAQDEMGKRIVDDFVGKMQLGPQKYNDFEKTISGMNLPSIPHIVQLTQAQDNTADLMYHLGKNPSKLATFLTLAYANPELANAEMRALSQSLKQNEFGARVPNINEPLSQLSPSSTLGMDSGSELSSFKKQPWARI